jgi:hypothetical protein
MDVILTLLAKDRSHNLMFKTTEKLCSRADRYNFQPLIENLIGFSDFAKFPAFLAAVLRHHQNLSLELVNRISSVFVK